MGKGEHPSMCRIQGRQERMGNKRAHTPPFPKAFPPKRLQMPSQGPHWEQDRQILSGAMEVLSLRELGQLCVALCIGFTDMSREHPAKTWNNLKSVKFGSHHYTSKS